jgi:hypothetical protein
VRKHGKARVDTVPAGCGRERERTKPLKRRGAEYRRGARRRTGP